MYVNKVLTYEGMIRALDKARIAYETAEKSINFTDRLGNRIFLTFEPEKLDSSKKDFAKLKSSIVYKSNGTKFVKDYYERSGANEFCVERCNFSDKKEYNKLFTVVHNNAGKVLQVIVDDRNTGKQMSYHA